MAISSEKRVVYYSVQQITAGAAFLLAGWSIAGCSGEAPDGSASGVAQAPLRGGTVVVGALGVVDIGNCTGSMVAPNVVLTAAHCFNGEGASSMNAGTRAAAVINYYDPASGRREVYSGSADWRVYPTYNGLGSGGPGEANDDLAVLIVPRTFEGTDYHDYLRIYAGADGPLDANLTAYGAGIYSYSGHSDDNLRKSWFEVQSVDTNHLVVDTRDQVSLCKGDSGSPLIKFATYADANFPTVAAVFSQLEIDEGGEGDSCSNNDPPHDDGYYCRVNSTKLAWVESKIGHACSTSVSSANPAYGRCFDIPFVEDVPGEGLERGVATAIVTSLL